MKYTRKLKIIFFFLLLTANVFSQGNLNGNYIRIKCIGVNNVPISIAIYKDSLRVWSWGVSLMNDSVEYSTQYFYNEDRQLIKFVNYRNSSLSEVHEAGKNSKGNLIPYVSAENEHEDCKGNNVECKKDNYGRLIELKTYRYGKDKSKKNMIIDTWYKYYYVTNLDYFLMLKNLIDR